MNLGESVRISWRAITGHKLRSTLTTLGVVVGIASVITFTMVGGAFEEDVLGDVEADNEPIVEVGTQTDPEAGTGIVTVSSPIYTETDVAELEAIDGVAFVAPSAERSAAQFRYGEYDTTSLSVQTTTGERFSDDGYYVMQSGETFTGPDEAVLTESMARAFEENVSVGDEVEVAFEDGSSHAFTVSGIVALDVGNQGAGQTVYVSAEDHYDLTIETPDGSEEAAYESLVIRTESVEDVEDVQQVASDYFENDAHATELKEDDHRIEVQTLEDQIDQFTAIVDQIRTFVVGIAALSLVVGSFGIANIMVVSVTERTREIGIMKAVGARKRDVVQLFLVESVILGTIGAIVGVTVGLGVGYLGVAWLGWPLVSPWQWVGVAVAVGVGVGILSGLYPAWRGASVDPIEALRRE